MTAVGVERVSVPRVVAVAAGGVVGTLMRVAVVTVMPPSWSVVAIMGVNLLGAFVLGLLVGHVTTPRLRQFLLTGVLGSFTTFSTFMVDAVVLLDGEVPIWWMVVHVVVTVSAGLALARLGIRLGTRPDTPRSREVAA